MSEFAAGGPCRGDGPVWLFGCDYLVPAHVLRLGELLSPIDDAPRIDCLDGDEE